MIRTKPLLAKPFIDRMDAIMKDLYALQHTYNAGMSLVDNYNWRALIMGAIIQKELGGEVIIHKNRTGVDASVKGRAIDIEFKSSTAKQSGSAKTIGKKDIKAEFDKQHDAPMRAKVLGYEHLVISLFSEFQAVPLVTVYLPPAAMRLLQPTLKRKQAAKMSDFAARKAAGRGQGRDSISINLEEIAAIPGIEDSGVLYIGERKYVGSWDAAVLPVLPAEGYSMPSVR